MVHGLNQRERGRRTGKNVLQNRWIFSDGENEVILDFMVPLTGIEPVRRLPVEGF
jgi:hypothetical protein